MSYSRGYYGEREAQDALAVVAKWMGREKNLKVEYHGGTAVDADIFNGVIRIPRLAASNGLTEETINLLRGRVYHEAGHIFDADVLKKLKRIGKYPSGILFEIFNAVEDMRMERAVAERHAGAKPVFDWNAKYHNQKISEKMAEGEIDRPIWESLVAMMFQSAGMRPQWRLSEKAQKYFDDAYNKFTEWKKCQDSEDAYDLAEEIFEIMKQTHEQHQQEQEQSQESQNQNNEDQEQDQSEEQDGQGQGDNGGEDEQDQDGEGQGDDEGEEQDGQSEGSSKDFGDESADEEEQDGNGMESENDADQDVEQGGNSQGKSDDSDENGEAQDGEEETQEERDARLEEEMAEEAEGISLEEMQDADIAQAFDELEWEDRNYLADKSKDEHNVIEPQEHHMSRYMNERAEVSASVAGMANALLQALRARTRCKVNPYQKRGKIDNRQLVAIAKGLSKDVFYTTKQGEKLDTAVEIIIDESASMGGDDVRSCRRIALAVAEVLTQLNIPFEITGTTTKYMQGRSMPELHGGLDRTNPLVYNHYKTFEQGWHSVKHAIMQTGAHNHNVDGEAVEYCARRLMNRPEARKVVLSLSDGEPFAGHQNMSTMEENLKRSCARARENGVEVYGFGIGTHAPKAYYGAENFIHLPNRKMDTEFTKAFVKIVSGGQLFV